MTRLWMGLNRRPHDSRLHHHNYTTARMLKLQSPICVQKPTENSLGLFNCIHYTSFVKKMQANITIQYVHINWQ